MPDDTIARPRSSTRTRSRVPSIIPSYRTPPNIIYEVTNNRDRYVITADDKDAGRQRMPKICSLPNYLVTVARILNARLNLRDGSGPGFQVILRAALDSGISQLESDENVKSILSYREQSLAVKVSGPVMTEIQRINATWSFSPPAPGGYASGPKGYTLPILNDLDARIRKLADELSLTSQSLLMVIALCLGFYNQPEISDDALDANDYGNVIADTVHLFDMMIEFRVEYAERMMLLLRDAETRRAIAAQRLKLKPSTRGGALPALPTIN